MSTYTPEQWRAIHSDENLVVTAGAGAGKTRVLTQRWIRLLMDPAREIDQVVAITFTKKAAAEMLERCRKELRELAAGGDARAGALLERLDEARISTFHSFCQALLQQYPVEAGLDPEFGLADDLEARLLLSEAVDQCLVDAAQTADAAVIDLFTRYGRTGLAAHLERLIDQMRNLGETPATLRAATAAAAATHSDPGPLAAAVTAAVDALLAYATKPGSKGQEQQAQLRQTWAALAPRLDDLAGPGASLLVDDLRAMAEPINANAVKPKRPLVDAIEAIGAALATGEAARVGLAVIDLMEQSLARYHARKEQANLLDFSDLIDRVRHLLEAHPEVREELAAQDLIFLNDEVQDTDPSQWAVIRQMLTRPGEDQVPPGRLFIVGDPKQSIYRFRGARVEIFGQISEEVAAVPENRVGLMKNFRSQGRLIRLVNDLFSHVMAPGEGGPQAGAVPYAPMEWHRPEQAAAAELLMSASPGAEGRRQEAAQIAARIRELVDGGQCRYGDVAMLLQAMTHVSTYVGALAAAGVPYYVVAGDGFFETQELQDIENLLRVLSDPADAIALAGWLRSPHVGLSDNTLAAMGLHGQGFLAAWSDGAFQAPGSDRPVLERARQLLPRLRRLAWQEPLPRLLPSLYSELQLFPVLLAQPDGEAAVANLQKLAAMAGEFAARGRHQFMDLVRWLRSAREAGAREGMAATEEEGGNSVRIMTVHKSKGLEFPVVVLPDIGRSQKNDALEILLHPQVGVAPRLTDDAGEEIPSGLRNRAVELSRQESEQEFRRLFYVAATRARDYLILSAIQPRASTEGRAPATWLHWLQAACEANPELALPVRTAEAAARAAPAGALTEVAATTPLRGGGADGGAAAGGGVGLSPAAAELLRCSAPLVRAESRGEELQTSASRLMLYQDCPRRYYLQTMLGLPDLRRAPSGWEALATDPAEAEEAAEESRIEPTLRGTIVHSVCERLTDPNEMESLIAQEVQEHGIDLSHPDVETAIREPLRRYVASAFFQRVRGARAVHSELSFRLQAGGMTLEGFIDKVLVEADGAVVVDFKTNYVLTPERIAESAAHYDLQMQIYALAVQERLGLPVKEALLYFLVPGEARSCALDEPGLRWQLAELAGGLRAAAGWEGAEPNLAHCGRCPYQEFCRAQG